MATPSDHKGFPSVPRRCIRVNGPVIVGAGPTGLAAAARYRKRGVSSIVVLESAYSIASLWQSKPHLSSKFCQLPKLPYPTKREFTARLESYAKKHEINPRFNACVQSAKYDRTTRLWRVQTSSTSTSNEEEVDNEYLCKWLVDATGEKELRVTPEIKGLSQFEGPIIHARDYDGSEKKSFRGKNVLVVGCGRSGMDILLDLLNHKAFPIMVRPSSVSVSVTQHLENFIIIIIKS